MRHSIALYACKYSFGILLDNNSSNVQKLYVHVYILSMMSVQNFCLHLAKESKREKQQRKNIRKNERIKKERMAVSAYA